MQLERIIVTLTTWTPRLQNIPTVLDSIFNQTHKPDLVVINFSEGEIIPPELQQYLDDHHVECNFVPDTKVYKKLIPTLKKYPNDCIISIDDDWIYPPGMIEDFWSLHQKYPNYPISGNTHISMDVLSHCGCASLTKYEYFGNYLSLIDNTVMRKCLSDDIVYTYFVNKAGHPYIRTTNEYFTNMPPINPISGYSETNPLAIRDTIMYLERTFGPIESPFTQYITDPYLSKITKEIIDRSSEISRHRESTKAYKLGKFLLKWLPYKK